MNSHYTWTLIYAAFMLAVSLVAISKRPQWITKNTGVYETGNDVRDTAIAAVYPAGFME